MIAPAKLTLFNVMLEESKIVWIFQFIYLFTTCSRFSCVSARLTAKLQRWSRRNCWYSMWSGIQSTCTWIPVEIQFISLRNERAAYERRCEKRFGVQTAKRKWLWDGVLLGIESNRNANRAVCISSSASGKARTVD